MQTQIWFRVRSYKFRILLWFHSELFFLCLVSDICMRVVQYLRLISDNYNKFHSIHFFLPVHLPRDHHLPANSILRLIKRVYKCATDNI